MTRTAFTLVELMVAIALSLLIVATATAAFQVASKALTQSERLTKENQLVRSAYQAGVEDADFWFSVDDPFDPAGQPQRALRRDTGEDGNGNIFVSLDLPQEFHNWNVSDPRSFQVVGEFRTNRGGDYSLLSTVESTERAPAVRDWYPTMLDTVFHQLGTYATFEYFPPGTGYTWYLDKDDSNPMRPEWKNAFGDSFTKFRYSLAEGRWPNKMNMAYRVTRANQGERDELNNGRARVLHGMYTMVGPRSGWMLGDSQQHNLLARMTVDSSNGNENGGKPQPDWGGISQDLAASVPFYSIKPEAWPGVEMAVVRKENNYGRRVATAIKLVNPISGDIRMFNFHCIGTTLRGARMQRDWRHFGAAGIEQ